MSPRYSATLLFSQSPWHSRPRLYVALWHSRPRLRFRRKAEAELFQLKRARFHAGAPSIHCLHSQGYSSGVLTRSRLTGFEQM